MFIFIIFPTYFQLGEVVRLLETDGDFLVRETVRNEEKQIVLSVMNRSCYLFVIAYRKIKFLRIQIQVTIYDNILFQVMWSSPKHFIVQTSPEGLFRFEGPAFESVQELIIHQVRPLHCYHQ